MGYKVYLLFIGTCILVLFSLNAMADETYSPLSTQESSIRKLDKESMQEASFCLENADSCDSASIVDLEKNVEHQDDSAHLSFNFLYYILYKFKYIDSFHLSNPAKGTSKRSITIP